MNADKLLEDLREIDLFNVDSVNYGNKKHYIDQLESMLRQQQDEIEALKQIIDANNLNQNIGQFVKPTNEPVAWMDKESNITMIGGIYPKKLEEYLNSLEARIVALEPHPVAYINKDDGLVCAKCFNPLYTHPVKELTDEEIKELSEKHLDMDWQTGVIDFARAILRKASEK